MNENEKIKTGKTGIRFGALEEYYFLNHYTVFLYRQQGMI
jgi:hypothetical protein